MVVSLSRYAVLELVQTYLLGSHDHVMQAGTRLQDSLINYEVLITCRAFVCDAAVWLYCSPFLQCVAFLVAVAATSLSDPRSFTGRPTEQSSLQEGACGSG